MYYFRVGQTHVWTVDEARDKAVWDLKLIPPGTFSRRKLFPKVMRAHAIKNNLSLRPRLLIAHGNTTSNKWNFVDETKKRVPIQNWIDEHDGKTGTLLIFACNLLNLEIHSRFSLVIHLNRATSRWDLRKGKRLRLYHPVFGYIEDNYYRMHSILA